MRLTSWVVVAVGVGWLGGGGRRAAHAADGPPAATVANVVVVTWDGFRPEDFFGGAQADLMDKKAGGVPDVAALSRRFGGDTPEARRAALLPFVWGTMATRGQIFGDRSRRAAMTITNGKKFSYPGYNEMFCGFGDDRIDSNDRVPNPNPSIFEFLDARPDLKGKVAAFATWDVFPAILRSQQNGLPVHTAFDPIRDEPLTERQRFLNAMLEQLPRYWPDNGFDAITLGAAREHLIRHKPRVLYIGLGETDEWAHGRRYDLYLEAAHQGDRALADLWATVQSMPEYAGRTALVLTTDHGRGVTPTDWTSHGQKIDGAEFVWAAVLAPGVVPTLGVRSEVAATQSQVAATVARLLGEDFNAFAPRAAAPLPGVLATPAAASGR